MKLIAYFSDKEIDKAVAGAFVAGARVHGVDAVAMAGKAADDYAIDAVVLFGVKARARFDAFRAAGVNTIVLDKGYVRWRAEGPNKWCEFWRVAVNAHHPTRYLATMRSPSDRFDRLGLEMLPWRPSGKAVIYAGSSAKYHSFNGLAPATRYARKIVSRLRELTERPIIYRPKPSWHEAEPVRGAAYSRPPEHLSDLLPNAHALVTNGSNASFEAILAGVPTIVLGEAVSAPLSSDALEDIETPRLADMEARLQWAADLAYCQWTLAELRSGEAWPHIDKQLRVVA